MSGLEKKIFLYLSSSKEKLKKKIFWEELSIYLQQTNSWDPNVNIFWEWKTKAQH